MKSVFFTDPHLGKVLQSHTTPASRGRLSQALFEQVDHRLTHSWRAYDQVFCLGDLFDKFSNKEETLAKAYQVLNSTNACMAGNHDLIADSKETSSLQLLDGFMGEDSPVILSIGGWDEKDYTVHFVPHYFNQKAFDDAVYSVRVHPNKVNILCLHCNYDSDFATQETSLNLTKEGAKFLIEEKGFDYILIGHEHNAAVHFGGKLIILGNTHPTSFHDISDKFAWIYDSKTNSFSKEQIYDAAERFWKVSAEDFLAGEFPSKELHWVQIEGTLDSGQAIEFAKKVRQLWQQIPSLFAIRVEAKAKSAEVDGFSAEGFMQIMTQIQQEVEGMGDAVVFSLYQEICEEVRLEREKENAAQN
jgi:DNA repair exonuclease SbcCD nuclease subunit